MVKCAAMGERYKLYLDYEYSALHRLVSDLVKLRVLKLSKCHEYCTLGSSKLSQACFRLYGVTLDDDKTVCKTRESDGSSFLHANESIYCMIHLYDLLYERIYMVKEMARANASDHRQRNDEYESTCTRQRYFTSTEDRNTLVKRSNLSLRATAQCNPLCYILVLVRASSYKKLSLLVPRSVLPPKG